MDGPNYHTTRFPNDPLFVNLLEKARTIEHVIIKDHELDIQADYKRLLGDVVAVRRALHNALPPDVVNPQGCNNGNIHIAILARGYELAVAVYAVLAMGCIAFPLASWFPDETANTYIKDLDVQFLLLGSEESELSLSLQRCRDEDASRELTTISVSAILSPSNICRGQLLIDDSITFSPKQTAVVLLTSGMTGPPKGVPLPRQMFYNPNKSFRRSTDVAICSQPLVWISGLFELVSMINAGACAELFNRKIGNQQIFDRLQQGGITLLGLPAHRLASMKAHFECTLVKRTQQDLDQYIKGIQDLRFMWTSGAMPSPPLKRFWRDMRGGKPLLLFYGSTEAGGLLFREDMSKSADVKKRYIGTPVEGVEVKLSDGDHGELLVKKPSMFTGYIGVPGKSKNIIDEQGFYKTGDLVKYEDGKYVIDGRESDFVRISAFRSVSIPVVQESVCELPYVAEAYVLALSSVFRVRFDLAALVRLTPEAYLEDEEGHGLSIEKLRLDLSCALEADELPNLLRVLGKDEPFPEPTPSGKFSKANAIQMYFPFTGDSDAELPVELQVWRD